MARASSPTISSSSSNQRNHTPVGAIILRDLLLAGGGEMPYVALQEAYKNHYGCELTTTELSSLLQMNVVNNPFIEETIRKRLHGCAKIFFRDDELMFCAVHNKLSDSDHDLVTLIKKSPKRNELVGRTERGCDTISVELKGGGDQCRGVGPVPSLENVGAKLIKATVSEGPLILDRLDAFFTKEYGNGLAPAAFGERNWEGVIKRIMEGGSHPSLFVHGKKIGIREHFLVTQKEVEELSENKAIRRAQKEDSCSLMLADLVFHLLEANNESMEESTLTCLLSTAEVNAVNVAASLGRDFAHTFRFESSSEESVLSLVDGAAIPSVLGEEPSRECGRMGYAHVLSDVHMNDASKPLKVSVHKLSAVRYGGEEWRLEFGLILCDTCSNIRRRSLHDKMGAFYEEHWEDESLMLNEVIWGDCFVVRSPNSLVVHRARFLQQKEDGTLSVLLIDLVKNVSTTLTHIRRLASQFTIQPAFGIVTYSAPFRVLPGMNQEMQQLIQRTQRTYVGKATVNTQMMVRMDCNPEERKCRVLQLYEQSERRVCLPDDLVNHNLVEMTDQ